ncbi:MAG TPA: MarR family winged helix-turn-helix transcriptional regulator [Mesotoga infera]|nr:MarR family winged helix-turn-helix transcriptional regulator [Mesotoga infera]HPD36741.1 MarR family winged helix-turn-helix transcriptional regulator [Mesotoga infera]HRR45497.1 MarR family winged helix-turn-helix transcriptional regulator [Mesotoga sp.]HRV03372.1 MarR family winged helix-turn-helix transcriptional regulator [Mesotoga sp.]
MTSVKEKLITIVERFSTLMAEREERSLNNEGSSRLTVRQMYYLNIIAKMDRPTISQMAERLSVTKPTVTTTVRKFIEEGYLKRIQSEGDRRIFWLELTNRGRKVIQTYYKIHKDFSHKICEVLDTREAQELIKILEKILRKIDS